VRTDDEGKGSGEHSLLRRMLRNFKKNDVVVGDQYYGSYWLIVALMSRGGDCVFPRHVMRDGNFRGGVRDHIVLWRKPVRPAWMDEETYKKIPDEIKVREVQVGGRILITTFLNPREVGKKEIGELYGQRWQVEVDLRAIKTVLQMDILRCKTPEMVNKEIAVHLLGYNLIRTVMAQAAWRRGVLPREISFKATIQLLNAFREKSLLAAEKNLNGIRQALFEAIARHCVMDRPVFSSQEMSLNYGEDFWLKISSKSSFRLVWMMVAIWLSV
jgi:hypothetical protein